MESKSIQEKFEFISYYFFLAFIFFLPLDNQRNNFLLGGFLFFSVINKNFYHFIKEHYRQTKALWIPVLLFVVLGLETVFSENLNLGSKFLFHQLGLFIFPIFVPFLIHKFRDKLKTMAIVFIVGVFFTAIYLLAFAFYRSFQWVDGSWQLMHFTYPLANMSHFYAITHGYSYFTYIGLSVFMHNGYFALYILIALIVLYYQLGKYTFFSWQKIGLIIITSYLMLIFVLLMSRAVTLAFFVAFIIGIVYSLIRNKSWIKNSLILAIGFMLALLILQFNGRFGDNKPEEAKIEQNANVKDDRMIIWEISLELISKKWLMGYGTGDYRIEMLKAYEKGGYEELKARKANSHNQFFETSLQTGIIGLFLLLLMFLALIYKGVKLKKVEIVQISVAIFIAFFFESMLLRISGVYIFALSYVLLMAYVAPKEEINKL